MLSTMTHAERYKPHWRCDMARFMAMAYKQSCDRYAYERGPGLLAVEALEKTMLAKSPELAQGGMAWFLSCHTAGDIQQLLQDTFNNEQHVRLVFGRSRKHLWNWAERERAKDWDERSPALIVLCEEMNLTFQPRENPFKE